MQESFEKSPKILIIGAGLSGIFAASKLIENGFNNVIILEAENRIGGRVHCEPFAGGVVDLGAQFVHGEKENAIFQLVNKHSELILPEYSENDYLKSNGEAVNHEICFEIDKKFSNWLKDLPETRNESVGSLMEQKCDDNETQLGEKDRELVSQMCLRYEKQSNVGFASNSWRDISTFYKRFSQECEGNQMIFWKDGTFTKVLDYIMKKNNSHDFESKVHLKKKVSNIKWNETDQIQVSCEDGSRYSADHAIVTVSLGVLKDRHETLFTPRLPEKKVKAIEALGFGGIGKIYLEFEKPFWPSDKKWFGYSLIWSEDDLNKIKGTDREWLSEIVNVIRVDGKPNILQAFICPKYLKSFEALTSEKAVSDFMWMLSKFLKTKLPQPKDMKRTEWLSNKNFLGTSPFYSMESEKQNVTPKDLAETLRNKVHKPLILFAGEATHEKFSGFSHGAVESGWRAAEEILSFFKK